MSLKHAILGYLAQAPLSGYDLKKSFDQSLGHLWPADQSQIYRTLSDMVSENLLEVEIFPRQDRLARKVYYITDQGQDELYRWLTTPLDLPIHRSPFMLQLHFGNICRDDEILKLLENQRWKIQQRLDITKQYFDSAKERHKIFDNPRYSFFNLLPIEHAIASLNTYHNWIQNLINQIELGDYSLTA